jgi:hypothetical protein
MAAMIVEVIKLPLYRPWYGLSEKDPKIFFGLDFFVWHMSNSPYDQVNISLCAGRYQISTRK